MKSISSILFLILLVACNKHAEHADHDNDKDGDDPNLALYNQVDEIHNEVMPKMQDLYNYKKDFLEKIANTPTMPAEQKKDLEKMISSLDSADMIMRKWMHEFNPPSDSTDAEVAREYLETQIEEIKKVRDRTNETLEKAKTLAGKN